MKKVNQELERLCKERKVPFLHTCRLFLYKNKPIRSLFAVRDNDLHRTLKAHVDLVFHCRLTP